MKKIKKSAFVIIILFFFIPLLSLKSYAGTADELLSDFSAVIPDKYADITEDPNKLSEGISASALIAFLYSELSSSGEKIGRLLLFTLGICALSAMSAAYKSKLSRTVRFGVLCLCMSALLAEVVPLLSSAMRSLKDATEFFSSVIPVLCAVNASGGGASTASVQAAGMALSVSLCTVVVSEVLPFIAAAVYSLNMLENLGADNKIATSAKNLYTKILGAVTLITATVFSLQNVISSAADSVAVRAAKYGAANLIPIVGSTVSSSLGLLSSSLAYVKSIAGAGTVAVLIYILISPLAMLLIYKLIFSVCSSIESALGGGISAVAPTLGIIDCVIASYSLCSVLYIFEIILFMKYGLVL